MGHDENKTRGPKDVSRVKFIFFDLDDTLIDTTAAVRGAIAGTLGKLRAVLRARGYEPPPAGVEDELLKLFGSSFAREFFAAWLYEAGLGDGLRRDLLAEALPSFRAAIAAVPPHAGAADVLSWLAARGIGRGLITDGRVGRQREKLERSGLAPFFGPVLISGSYEPFNDKPALTMFEEGLAAAGVAPAEAMFVGDRVKDVVGANLAGMVSVRVRQGWAKDEEGPRGVAAARADFELPAIKELPSLWRGV